MKAIVYDGIQKVQCREVPAPKIEEADDIIVKVIGYNMQKDMELKLLILNNMMKQVHI